MERQPLVSVIMPAYNQAAYVAEAIESVIAQTYGNWELIIVDDGSPDNVAEIVRPFAEAEPRISFYHTENGGVSRARNYAVEKSKGEYLLPLDADDTIEPSYVEKCVEEFARHPEASVVYCKWRFFGAATEAPPIGYTDYLSLLINNSIFATAMFPRHLFERIGGFDEGMTTAFEDWEMWIRLLEEDSVVVQIPEVLFNYRIKASSRNADANSSAKAFEAEMYIIWKHRDKYNRYFGLPTTYFKREDIWRQRYEHIKRKYDRIWYRRLWKGIRGRK